MPVPTAADMGAALSGACEAAGLTQEQVAEALGVHQTTVSKWLLGKTWPPYHHLPVIDELCGQPRGHVLRRAGFVDDDKTDVEAAIEAESLAWHEKDVLIFLYNRFRTRSAET